MNGVTWFIGSGALKLGLTKTDNMKVKHGVYSIKMEINYAQLTVCHYRVYFLCFVDRESPYICVIKTN